MTAIEEIGKIIFLRTISISNMITLKTKLSLNQEKEINKVLRDHSGKALEIANSSLYINQAADRRYGINSSGLHRTSGVVLLVYSGKWMEMPNL